MPNEIPGKFLALSLHLQPRGRGGNSDLAQYSNTPILRVPGFEDDDEDSLPDEALTLSVGSFVGERSRENEV